MKPIQQITLRLPEDLARRLAACTPSRKRNQFVVDLVRRELDRESRELEEAALRLSSLEAAYTSEDAEWLAFDDDAASGHEFDEQRFLKELSARNEKTPKTARTLAA
jgi:metal-responsive CopG/Arc/MetJ family transcriptional regulator